MTEISQLSDYYKAEEYHQKYIQKLFALRSIVNNDLNLLKLNMTEDFINAFITGWAVLLILTIIIIFILIRKLQNLN